VVSLGVAQHSVGFTLPDHTPDLLEHIPDHVWVPALDAHDEIRDGAWVAELTNLLDLTGWPKGMRVIARKERPHPGAQLRITDIDGHRVTAFLTNTKAAAPARSCPTSSSATGAGPGARTGSAPRRTPAYARSPWRASTRTRSGATSWPSPPN